MRLLGLNVARTTEGTITVEYHGEGNELITVRMSVDSAVNDEQAVIFAEKMMDDMSAARRASRSTQGGQDVILDGTLASEAR